MFWNVDPSVTGTRGSDEGALEKSENEASKSICEELADVDGAGGPESRRIRSESLIRVVPLDGSESPFAIKEEKEEEREFGKDGRDRNC